jgi:monoamine oxidase
MSPAAATPEGGVWDAVVVGAGAAGLAAARTLVDAGRSVLVLEARERVGGRAWTQVTRLGVPIDLGCEWLHSADRNPWTGIARELGFTVNERTPDWGNLDDHRAIPREERRAWRAARDALHVTIEEAAASGPDRPAAELLPPDGRWAAILNAVSSFANGVELDRLSAHDNARYHDSGVNWRLCEGYGALMERYADGLPIRLGIIVRHIEHDRKTLRLETSAGSIEAHCVVVAVPPTLLCTGALRFAPELPEKLDAAAGLPLGFADKVFLELRGAVDDFPADHHVLGTTDRTATGSYQLRPQGRPLIAAFLGGRNARDLEAAGDAAMIDFAVGELVGLFGSAIRARLAPLATTAWGLDPYALGAYSYALPGRAGDRARLAAPVEEQLFFAGEAVSPHDFSTAHGAYLSGIAAAGQVLAALGARSFSKD